MTGRGKYLGLLSSVFLAVLVWSGIAPKDYFTWILEVTPGIIGFALLAVTYRKFRFTDFVYTLILLHCCILFVGGHYTYAEVPLFDWIKTLVNGSRNNYDKVGHFAQGFVPALIARELFLRLRVVNGKKMGLFFRRLLGPRRKRILRTCGMVDLCSDRRVCRSISRHPGLCLGHPVRYALGPHRRNGCRHPVLEVS